MVVIEAKISAVSAPPRLGVGAISTPIMQFFDQASARLANEKTRLNQQTLSFNKQSVDFLKGQLRSLEASYRPVLDHSISIVNEISKDVASNSSRASSFSLKSQPCAAAAIECTSGNLTELLNSLFELPERLTTSTELESDFNRNLNRLKSKALLYFDNNLALCTRPLQSIQLDKSGKDGKKVSISYSALKALVGMQKEEFIEAVAELNAEVKALFDPFGITKPLNEPTRN